MHILFEISLGLLGSLGWLLFFLQRKETLRQFERRIELFQEIGDAINREKSLRRQLKIADVFFWLLWGIFAAHLLLLWLREKRLLFWKGKP
jgi:hypothetical protein